MHITNAKISNTMLGIEDHGIMTFSLTMMFDGCGQGFGGYCLDGGGGKTGHAKSIIAIRRILETVGVDKWEDLKDKLVRIKKESSNPSVYGGSLDEIGHIMDDKWFNVKEFFANE